MSFITVSFLFTLTSCAQRLDEYETRLADLDERARILESKSGLPVGSDRELLENRRLADVRTQLAALRNEITVLQGQSESIEFEQKALRDEIEKINRRLVSQSSAPAPVPVSSANLDPEVEAYQKGLRLHQNGSFRESRGVFKDFLESYPKSQWADNALYWVGEGLLAEREYKRALVAFQDMITKYKDSDKKCDAMARQVEAFRAIGKEKEAQSYADVRTAECRAE